MNGMRPSLAAIAFGADEAVRVSSSVMELCDDLTPSSIWKDIVRQNGVDAVRSVCETAQIVEPMSDNALGPIQLHRLSKAACMPWRHKN
jgi:hypothetical protein